ncbi:hypothetical protein [Deferrisoma camini]|uniref:hypothetical protein n=1 Tax=Deferrisoma camini TaxID=1035120 RepID=UPI00046C9510|nr:hypothetical protein [Deferrisoma camini]
MFVSFRSVLVGVVIGLGLVGAPFAWAASTVSCHCFRDRSFDPARPAAADTYVLATSRNSLLAAAFGVSKGTVVRSLMTGTAPEALWAAHGLAARTGLRADDLLTAHGQAGSWARALERLGYDPARVGGRVGELVRAGQDPAPAVVDETLATRMGVPRDQIAALRAAGASDAETVAASVLGRLTGKEPVGFLKKVRAGEATWGSLFHDAGVAPSDIDDAIARLLR